MQNLMSKSQYKQSFKNRHKILKENSVRSKLYKVRYTTVSEYVREFVKSNDAIIIDAGCGDGVFFSEIICEYPQLVGLDLSIKSLLYIKEQKQIQHVPLIQGDIENLPFKSNELLSVVCIETLEHLMNIEKGLQEIHRVLRPNGVLIATVPFTPNLRNVTIVGEHKIKLLSFLRGFMRTLRCIQRGYVMHTWKDDQGFEFPHRVYWMWKIKRIIEDCSFIVQVITNTPLVISSNDNPLMALTEKMINRITRNRLGELFVVCAIKKSDRNLPV